LGQPRSVIISIKIIIQQVKIKKYMAGRTVTVQLYVEFVFRRLQFMADQSAGKMMYPY